MRGKCPHLSRRGASQSLLWHIGSIGEFRAGPKRPGLARKWSGLARKWPGLARKWSSLAREGRSKGLEKEEGRSVAEDVDVGVLVVLADAGLFGCSEGEGVALGCLDVFGLRIQPGIGPAPSCGGHGVFTCLHILDGD